MYPIVFFDCNDWFTFDKVTGIEFLDQMVAMMVAYLIIKEALA